MLDHVMYNLLNNAAIHTDSSARIDVSVSCHADLLNIKIEDTGKGFNNVDVKNVFDKFSRSRDLKSSRSGLGLSIVKGFTEAMSGVVELEKVNPHGSRFIVSIPVKTSLTKLAEI